MIDCSADRQQNHTNIGREEAWWAVERQGRLIGMRANGRAPYVWPSSYRRINLSHRAADQQSCIIALYKIPLSCSVFTITHARQIGLFSYHLEPWLSACLPSILMSTVGLRKCGEALFTCCCLCSQPNDTLYHSYSVFYRFDIYAHTHI